MSLIRTEFAGSWYPDSETECTREIEGFLKEKEINAPAGEFTAAIVPHAGWYFSGSVACNAINCLRAGTPPDIIIIMGKHLRSTDPATILTDGELQTPLGNLTVAEDFSSLLLEQGDFQKETARSYRPDNTIELQLPFIKYLFGDTIVIPMGIPCSRQALRIGESIVEMAKREGVQIKIIGSTDLTHYGPNYGFEPAGSGPEAVAWMKNINDRRVVDTLISVDAVQILSEASTHHNACCAGAASALMAAANKIGCTKGELIKYTTSFDKHPSDSFVGYAGVVYPGIA